MSEKSQDQSGNCTTLPSLTPPFLVAVIGLLILAPESIAKTFTLTIDGDQGASFVGSCLAVRGDEQDVLALSGQAPFEQAVEADFMSCRFNATGRISIKATSDAGQERMVETKNGVITLSLR